MAVLIRGVATALAVSLCLAGCTTNTPPTAQGPAVDSSPIAAAPTADQSEAPTATTAPTGAQADAPTATATAPDANATVAIVASPPADAAMEQMLVLVRADLARSFEIDPASINLVSSEARMWPDAGLGCAARRGLRELRPTPGYLIVLGYGDKSYPYHTDRSITFVRCSEVTKPIDPIR